jgi:hypothetical protein
MEDYGLWTSRGIECGMWPVECLPTFGTTLVMLS